MIRRKKITERHARYAIANGEFAGEVVASRKHVAIILTQSWCPDWLRLNQSLRSLEKQHKYEIDIYELEYDRVNFFDDFRRFKENVLKNHLIPYVRYYTVGKLVGETNYVSIDDFLSIFNLS